MPTAPAIVKLEQVDAVIDSHPVLTDISLEIFRGQHWGITGSNGSGKSTLLALLAGKRWPAPGRGRRIYDFGQGPELDAVTAQTRITLLGHELQDLYRARGWNFRARDIVLSGLTRTDIPRRNPREPLIRRAAELLDSMGIADLADRRLLELSRGEQRRVLIARALAFEPALLLLDEPASGLDAESREALFGLLERASRDTPLIVAAHAPDELPPFITHVATIERGRLGGDRPAGPVAPPAPKADCAAAAQHASDEALIAVEAARVWIAGRTVLQRFDWQLKAGEQWLVTGPNGAGKSTFLRLLHGEIRPARGGRIRWPGLGDPRDVWTLRRRISLVSPELQASYLYPTRVFDAVASGFDASIGLTRRLESHEIASVVGLLEEFELEPLQDRLFTKLSYGQRHRVLIARTLVAGPRVLLLDEPWEGLDTGTAELVRRALARRMHRDIQVICVSHVGARGLELNRHLRIGADGIVSADDNAGQRGN